MKLILKMTCNSDIIVEQNYVKPRKKINNLVAKISNLKAKYVKRLCGQIFITTFYVNYF